MQWFPEEQLNRDNFKKKIKLIISKKQAGLIANFLQLYPLHEKKFIETQGQDNRAAWLTSRREAGWA